MADEQSSDVTPELHLPGPVDRMAELKAQASVIDREYKLLREQILNGALPAVGLLWEAVITTQSRRIISLEDAKRLLPANLFKACVTETTQTMLTLKKRSTTKEKSEKQRAIAKSRAIAFRKKQKRASHA